MQRVGFTFCQGLILEYWKISPKCAHERADFIQLLHSHLVHIPLLRVHSAGEYRDSLADELLKNAGLEIKPFLIMVQQVLSLKAGKKLDLNSVFSVVSSQTLSVLGESF